MLYRETPKSAENVKKWNFPQKLSTVALALSLLFSQQPSNAETIITSNTPKIEKQTKQIDVSWIREGIKSSKDIDKINKIFWS